MSQAPVTTASGALVHVEGLTWFFSQCTPPDHSCYVAWQRTETQSPLTTLHQYTVSFDCKTKLEPVAPVAKAYVTIRDNTARIRCEFKQTTYVVPLAVLTKRSLRGVPGVELIPDSVMRTIEETLKAKRRFLGEALLKEEELQLNRPVVV